MCQVLVSSVVFGAIPVAALTHCKINFFWEVMVERCHLVALSWCSSFSLMTVSGAGVVIADQ